MPSLSTSSSIGFRFVSREAVESTRQIEISESVSALTRGLASGDEQAFCDFHARYFDRLFRFLLVMARGREDEAKEALQQTLLRVARYARPFENEEAFWCWLKALARSSARDAARKENRYLAAIGKWFAHFKLVHASDEEGETDAYALLSEALDELEAPDRQVVESKYLDGLTVREIAAETGLTEKAVESRLLRARQQLKQKIVSKL